MTEEVGAGTEVKTGGCPPCELQCSTLYEIRDFLNQDKDLLRRYRGTDEEDPPGIAYTTVVRWAQEGVFPRAHVVGGRWVVPVQDLEGIAERLPIRGNPDWLKGLPRKAKKNYKWEDKPLVLAKRLFDLEPYELAGGELAKPYALRVIRTHLQELPEEFRDSTKYPRIQLGRELAKLAQKVLESVVPTPA